MKFKVTSDSSPKKTIGKRFSLLVTERRLKRACTKIVLLNEELSDLRSRYAKACQENRHSYKESLKLRLDIVQGYMQSCYDYADRKGELAAHLCREVSGDEVRIIGSDDTSDF